MLCGRRRRCTSTGSPAQNNGPCFWPALPSPPQLVPRGPPIVDHNKVAHHAVRSASTLHLDREPCSEQWALFLACPTLPHSWAQKNPLLSIRIGLPIMLFGRRRRCTSTGSTAQNNGPCFWPALPSPPHLVPGDPLLSIKIGLPIMLFGRHRRCTSTESPAQNNRPCFWPALPSPPQLGPRRPLLSIKIGLPIMLCGRRRRCTSTASPAQNNGLCFWPALPSPPQLSPRRPPIVD